jgi:hypothetical protein
MADVQIGWFGRRGPCKPADDLTLGPAGHCHARTNAAIDKKSTAASNESTRVPADSRLETDSYHLPLRTGKNRTIQVSEAGHRVAGHDANAKTSAVQGVGFLH